MTSLLQDYQLDELEQYPESDGKPMAENTEQYRWIVMIKENLEILFSTVLEVFIAADLFWYPVPNTPTTKVPPQAPDVMVVFGRPKGKRGTYRQWEEDNLAPQVVFEILSPSNKTSKGKREMQQKLEFYQTYGVEEYYLYDPETFEFWGWLRQGERLAEIATLTNWVSPRLGIRFAWQLGEELEVYNPDGSKFLSSVELAQQAKQERMQKELAQRRTEQERMQKEQERMQKEQERMQKELAQQKVEQLAAYLRSLGINPDDIAP